MESPSPFIDHTLLKPTAIEPEFVTLCEEAVELGFASVCVPPSFVPSVAERLYGSEVAVGTVVGFPCGYSTLRQKISETAELVASGAQEIDMVISISRLLEEKFSLVEEEVAQVVLAAEGAVVKVIIECCYLTNELKRRATELVVSAGAGYVKTSTGFASSGAAVSDVKLLAATAAGRVGVKAAGGIRDLASCQQMLAAGATRIGTSAGVQIAAEWQALSAGMS